MLHSSLLVHFVLKQMVKSYLPYDRLKDLQSSEFKYDKKSINSRIKHHFFNFTASSGLVMGSKYMYVQELLGTQWSAETFLLSASFMNTKLSQI